MTSGTINEMNLFQVDKEVVFKKKGSGQNPKKVLIEKEKKKQGGYLAPAEIITPE